MTNNQPTKIRVSSIPLKEVIADIATAFNTNYSEEFDEYEVKIPNELGKGFVRGINFHGGLGLLVYECLFFQEMEISFIKDSIHPLKFLYIMDGVLTHRFEHTEVLHGLSQYQNAIVNSANNDGHVLCFSAGVHTVLNSIEVDRATFVEKFEKDISKLTDGLKKLFGDISSKESFYHEGYFSLKIADLIKELSEFEKKEMLRKLFLEGITYQMLTQQIIEYLDDQKDEGKKTVLRKYEVTQIKKAADYIETNLGNAITVEYLAQLAGLNINKLQQGFKLLYDDTVNAYVQKRRFFLAKELMLNSDLSISEIINRIGLSSKSYFSKIFREEYGISPSEFRKQNKFK